MTNLNILLFLGKTNNNIKFPQTLGWLNWLRNFVEHVKQSQQRKKKYRGIEVSNKITTEMKQVFAIANYIPCKVVVKLFEIIICENETVKKKMSIFCFSTKQVTLVSWLLCTMCSKSFWNRNWFSWTKNNGILLPKLFWPIVRKKCFSDREKLLKFEAEDLEFAKILRSLEQFIQTVKGQNNFC